MSHIAIIGAGRVGSALAQNLTAIGDSVFFGVPDPEKYAVAAGRFGARIGTVEEASSDAAIVILAVPYVAGLEIAVQMGDWNGRILVDASNPIAPGFAGLSVGTTTSAAEQIAQRAANARVVKCFNVTGAENMADPRTGSAQVFMPVASDDADARATVIALAARMGFDAIDAGSLSAARYLEPLAMAWIHLAYARGQGRDWAFSRTTMRS